MALPFADLDVTVEVGDSPAHSRAVSPVPDESDSHALVDPGRDHRPSGSLPFTGMLTEPFLLAATLLLALSALARRLRRSTTTQETVS